MLEVADIVRLHGAEYRKQYGNTLNPERKRALRDIAAFAPRAHRHRRGRGRVSAPRPALFFATITARRPSGFSLLFSPAAAAASPKHTIPERALDRGASIFHIRNWLSDSVQPRILPRL